MIFWREPELIQSDLARAGGGLVAFASRAGASCGAPIAYIQPALAMRAPQRLRLSNAAVATRPFSDYVFATPSRPRLDETDPLLIRLRQEVRDLVTLPGHPLPFYLQRGFSTMAAWPGVSKTPPTPPAIGYGSDGSVIWYDPGELLYTIAIAYPLLDAATQQQAREFVQRENALFPPLDRLPWSGLPWLKNGVARERYDVPFRTALSNWPPPEPNLARLQAIWSWVDATGDRAFAEAQWSAALALFRARPAQVASYGEMAGLIGFARLARWLGKTSEAAEAQAAAEAALRAGVAFQTYLDAADHAFEDPRQRYTGWSLPVFFGLTPDIGAYLRDRTGDAALRTLAGREEGDGLRWWYLTRVGVHAEVGETAYISPLAAWSHFLAHAYVAGAPRVDLERWLDRPWGRGDLYSIQKLVATLSAP